MKKYILIILLLIGSKAIAQNTTVKVEDLAVPSSPAFIITDITPTLVQNPTTPKSFVVGVAQSFQQSGTGFPNNYSAEFAPYWWLHSKGRNVYSLLGLIKTDTTKENPFSGLKFTSMSVAFINKDLIPDTSKSTQKIFSIGIRSTILKVHSSGYAARLNRKVAEWHKVAQEEMDNNAALLAEIARHPENQATILANYKPNNTGDIVKEINDIINQKPVFSMDVAAAYAVYGINDAEVRTGRAGAWTTISSYIPLDKNTPGNYFNINASVRYMTDNYQKNDLGIISKGNNLDIGGKAGFEFNQLSVGVESLYRYAKGIANTQNRTVGVISVKLTDNIYVNGTFGKDFAGPNKLISAFGINWGFGKEKVSLP